VHLEKVPNAELGPKSEATVIVKYTVEYVFGFDLKSDSFEIIATTTGIEVRLKRPVLVGSPFIKTSSHDIPVGGVLQTEKETIKSIYDKLPSLAQNHATAMLADEAIRALCEKKLLAMLSGFLAEQPGVAQVPVIAVFYV
jgi:hypothetical protein